MATLLVQEGNSERCFDLGDHRLVSVGRDDQCTLQILDAEISRRHLQIRFEEKEARHYAADYRSANGVFVNGERITRDMPLNDGDKIKIGHTMLHYLDADMSVDEAREAVRKKDEWKRSTIIDRDKRTTGWGD